MNIGILTMHKVLNYGSALQAWATQKTLENLGHEAVLIDYNYPNAIHLNNKNKLYEEIKNFLIQLMKLFPNKRRRKIFEIFWNSNYKLSSNYKNKESIFRFPPQYDIYIVGSDQVWNPKYINGDTTFFLDFVSTNNKCFSYASSIAQNHLDTKFENTIKKYLSKFQAISVREKSGVEIINRLCNKKAVVCLDPTLLLKSDDYKVLMEQSKIRNVKKPYILAYILDYAYNPYPYILKFIEKVYSQTKLNVIFIDLPYKYYNLAFGKHKRFFKNISPNDFVYLVANAEIVITTSFHGTAFALNFGKSVYSIIDDKSFSDSRIKNLLDICGVPERAIPIKSQFDKVEITTKISKNTIQNNLDKLRNLSVDFLSENINN